MANAAITALVGLAIAWAVSKAWAWRKAYASAKRSGFPVFLSPVHPREVWWLMLQGLLVPPLHVLPKKWTTPWLSLAQLFEIWKTGHQPFADIGSDTCILSTPRGNVLWTCDPKICHQLEASYPKLQKATDMLRFLEIWGPTVGSVEGDAWKVHHKVIMTGFNPSTNAAVWRETMRQSKALVEEWVEQGRVVQVMRNGTRRVALHVILEIFFHHRLSLGEADGAEPVSPGYEVPFSHALYTILNQLGVLLVTPRFLLRTLPFENVRETYRSFVDLTKYMQQIVERTRARMGEVAGRKHKSILESIVIAGSSPEAAQGSIHFPEASILGNVFFVLSAGHDTVANTMSFALIILTLYPEYQEKIQGDLDELLKRRPAEEWGVDHEYQALQDGWIGAVLKEVLRLYCVVQWLPRVATVPIDVVDSRGTSHTIPQDTFCTINFSAAFLNPQVWPTRPMTASRRAELHNSPAVDFDPTRWLADGTAAKAALESPDLLHFPFGQGAHACPGRYFALVEMTAMLATILLENRLELVVNEQTLQGCNGDGNAAWEATRDHAFRMLIDDVSINQNLEFRRALPIRIAKRD